MTDPRNETDPLPNGWTWEQAVEAACERSRIPYSDYRNGHCNPAVERLIEVLAKNIAQHEKPPVDEATELLAAIYSALNCHASRCELLANPNQMQTDAIAIIRDALANARAGE